MGLANGDTIVGVVMADGSGGFTGSFDVPYSATVGRTHLVTAVSLLAADSPLPPVEAMANHTAVYATASTSPVSVTSGDIVTIRGRNFPAFTLVTHLVIGCVGVVPRQETFTDRDGSFEAEVLVSQLELGDQVLRVQVCREVAIHVIKIVDPPLSGPTSEVFKVLIRRGFSIESGILIAPPRAGHFLIQPRNSGNSAPSTEWKEATSFPCTCARP